MTATQSSIHIERAGPVLIARAGGQVLRAADAVELIAVAGHAAEPAAAGVVIDLSGVDMVESAMLGALAEINDRQPLRVVGLTPLVESVLNILGILPLLVVAPTVADAIAGLCNSPDRAER